MAADSASQLNSSARLAALQNTSLLDSPPEEAFDRLTRLASRLLNTPVALVSLVDDHRQFFKSAVGLPEPWASHRETPLSHSFCQYVVITAQPLIVSDARGDARVCENLAVPDLGVIAYLGMPLTTPDGFVLGSFCVIDTQPRSWTNEEIDTVRELATSVMSEVRARQRTLEAEAARRQVAAILNRITDGFCAFDGEWRFTYLNQEMVKLLPRLGRTPEDLLGSRLWEEFPDLAGTVLDREYRRAVAEQVPVHFELFYPPIATWFEIRAYPSPDGLSVYFQDVTERKRQSEQLQEQREELEAANEELQAAYEELQAQQEELEVANEELREQQEDLLRTTAALRESERRFQAVFNQKLGFLAILEPDGKLIDCNDLPLHTSGFTRDQVLGRLFWETPWWHGLPDAQEALKRDVDAAAGGGTAQGQVLYRLVDGSERVVEYSVSPVLDDVGQVFLIIGEGRDITERVHAEERQRFLTTASEILTSSLDYELTLERVARHALPFLADLCMVDLVGPDGQLQRVATAHVDPAGEVLLHELQERFPPRPDSPQPAARAFRSGKTDLVPEVTDEARASRAYNEEHAELIRSIGLRSHLSVPLVARNQTIGVINLGLVRGARRYGSEEVTLAEELARRAALAVDNACLYHEAREAEALQQRRAREAQLVADVGVALCEVAELGPMLQRITEEVVNYLDAAFARIWTLNEAENVLELQASAGLYTHLDGPHARIAVGAYKIGRIAQNRQHHLTNEVQTDPNISDPEWARREGMVAFAGHPLVVEGRLVGVMALFARHCLAADTLDTLGSVADIIAQGIERKRLEEALQQRAEELAAADRAKDNFIAMLSHELRNPLAPALAALHVLRERSADDPSYHKAREVAERQLQNLARLVDDLLDVSRITRDKIELRTRPLDLAAAVARAVEALRPTLEQRRHTLSVSIPEGLLCVEGDPTRLDQVLTNLLTNAAKYTDPGGQVSVSVAREKHEAVVRVRDTGRGIPQEMLPHIFELFVQVDSSLDRSEGGLGIGLTLVRKLVEMHGGTVGVSSDGRGQGSEFTVRLPLIPPMLAAPEEAETPPTTAPAEACRLRVLIVDDNCDAAETLAEILEGWGHIVITAHAGPDALRAAIEHQPNVVLLDIGLPGMDGREVARRLRTEHNSQALLVALTGYGTAADIQQSQTAGFDHHLTKPVDLGELARLLAGGVAQDA